MDQTRLNRLMAFLDRDPTNSRLLEDAAQAAFEKGEVDLAEKLLARREKEAELPPSLVNLRALIALAQGQYEEAADILERLRNGQGGAELRFNLAWAYMMLARYEAAEPLLDAEAIAVSNRGPTLKIQALHHLERYDEALAMGADLARLYPLDEALMGALATLAMDADRFELAQEYAARAGDTAQGLSARGLFALDEQDSDGAIFLFDRALAQAPDDARAWVGKGLAMLRSGEPRSAAQTIERGATLFEDHLGSWVAAGWAYFLAGDPDAARQAFERVVAIDPRFAEGYGGLAVLDLIAGDTQSAEQNGKIAVRLDRNSMGGALAQSLLLETRGRSDAAEAIRAAAFEQAIGPRGETLAQILAASGSAVLRG